MSDDLRGTGNLIRLALRRDRFLLPGSVLGFAAIAASSASATAGLYPEPASRIAAAGAVNASAAIVAMYGRIYDPTSLGALAMFKPAVFGAVALAILMVIVVIRHTRAEEESGRLELVGAGVVGRAAPLAAALIVAVSASAAIGSATAAGLLVSGLPSAGSLAFGAGWAVTGMCFAGLAAATAQVATGARAASGLALAGVGAAYVLRAVGDLSEAGPGWLSWLSPIGWNQQVRAFAGDHWGVLALPLAATAGTITAAFLLRRRRDLGSGLLSERSGPATGRLGTPLALAWRLQGPTLWAWTIVVGLLGTVLGTIAHTVVDLLNSPGMQAIIQTLGGEQGLTEAFLAAEMGLLGTIVAAYGIVAVSRLRSEESAGHAEALLSTSVGRGRMLAAHGGLALAGVAWLLIVAGVGAGAGHGFAVGDLGQIGTVALGAIARIPAAWVLVALAVFVWGVWPRAGVGVWLAYIAFIVAGEFGSLWGVPQAVMDLSPFVHSPLLPGPDQNLDGVLWLTAVAVALLAAGAVAFRRRDLAA
ncbi:ABC transporter permease [Cryobacterium sp. PH31-AA6]|uniref:ABC transporter permease n=1 Tax=Cryobacterium sp. PH31-AA6 TaxID=3046205 RepID=UPI0024B94A49|nr:ABC transporter permease [Cryobacterium sp. PH31-AA6]MDJ0324524.1 ABC transporter permease [Cryobacterium sp. PH31-AA6]